MSAIAPSVPIVGMEVNLPVIFSIAAPLISSIWLPVADVPVFLLPEQEVLSGR